MSSRDGYSWTEAQGLKSGVPCIGAITPSSNLSQSDSTFDVVVVGAGYCGLTAARDASLAGLKVLLIEARDRIGGRSWSSNIDGYPYEMGGTWVYWGQANIWREIMRYGMQDQLEVSYDFSRGINKYLLVTPEGTQEFSHEEEDQLMQKALDKFVNVDGQGGRKAIMFPHVAKLDPAAAKYDRMSAADRIAEIQHDLTPNERRSLETFVLLCSGATLETTSFYEFLHWWAMSGYTYEGCIEYLVKYKFRGGQSSFAIRFFQEALATGNLKYAFNSPVANVRSGSAGVEVTTREGKKYRALKMISAMPLNILNSVTFDPPLNPGKKAAADIGHVNQCTKVHAEVLDKDLRSMTSINYPENKLSYGFGDGTTPAGNTHIVAFGGQHNHFHPEQDIQKTMSAMQGFAPMKIHRLVFHNWSNDEFAKGAWFFSPPGLLADHLPDMRANQGNIVFACSDWALGWRSFIDGAIEEGTRAAMVIRASLAERPRL